MIFFESNEFCTKAIKLFGDVSQMELAKKIGISQGVISSIKNYKAKAPAADTIFRISKYFNVSSDYLLGLPNEKSARTKIKLIKASSIGNRISILRQREGLTQQELADLLNTRRENVSYWENGTRDIKSETIVLIAETLNTTADYLLGLSDVPSVDTDLKAVCDYTGLSQEAVELLKNNSDIDAETLRTFLDIRDVLGEMISIIKKN